MILSTSFFILFMIKSLGNSFNEILVNRREIKVICPLGVDVLSKGDIIKYYVKTNSKKVRHLY